jgi:hypothetical protein
MMQFLFDTSIWLIEILNPISQFAFTILIFIFLPLTIFKKTRGISGLSFLVYSYLFGAIVWFIGFATTIIHWGGWGLIIGLFLIPGLGVVPIGLLGEFIYGETGNAWYFVLMLVFVFIFRAGGLALVESYDNYQAEKDRDRNN